MALTGWWNGTGEDVGTMPRRPNTPCKHPGCGRLVPYGTMYCEEHKPLHQHDRKTTSRERIREPLAEGTGCLPAVPSSLREVPCQRTLCEGNGCGSYHPPPRGSEIVLGSGQLAGSLQILPRFQNNDRGQIRGISLPGGAVKISVTLPLKRPAPPQT